MCGMQTLFSNIRIALQSLFLSEAAAESVVLPKKRKRLSVGTGEVHPAV